MKKKIAILLALVLVFTVVATSCGAKEDPKKEETKKEENKKEDPKKEDTKKMTGEISVQVEKDWMDYYKKAADRVVAKHPDVKINLIEVASFDHLETLDKTSVTNPDVADVFAFPADRLYGLNEKEALANMDAKKMAEELGGFEDFDKSLGGRFNINGQYVGFPFNIETLVAFVNKKNAETNGVDITKTIEMKDIEDPATVIIPVFNTWFGVAITNAGNIEFLSNEGGFKSDMTKPWAELSDDQKAVITEVYNYWVKHNKAGTPMFDKDAAWGYIDEQFKTGGKGVAQITGPWDQAKLLGLAGEENLEIAPISKITVDGKPLKHWKGGWGLAINSRLEQEPVKLAIAQEMIKEIVNPEYAADLFKATGKILENAKYETYEKSDLSDVQKTLIKAVYDSYATSVDRPLFSEWGGVWDTWQNALLSWNTTKPANAEEAYKEIKASFDAMMTNIK